MAAEVAVGEVEDLVAALGDVGFIGGELVGEEDVGLDDEGACDRDALLLTAGEFLDEVVGDATQADKVENVARLVTYLRASEPACRDVWLNRDLDVLRGGEQAGQAVALQHEPQPSVRWVAANIARVRAIEPAEYGEQAGLAAAGRAHHADDLAGLREQRDAIEQGASASPVAELGGNQGSQSRPVRLERRGSCLGRPWMLLAHAAPSLRSRPSWSRMVRSRPAAT